jgi:hypothetical protein
MKAAEDDGAARAREAETRKEEVDQKEVEVAHFLEALEEGEEPQRCAEKEFGSSCRAKTRRSLGSGFCCDKGTQTVPTKQPPGSKRLSRSARLR